MIETKTGLKIVFTKLDEWAIQMTVSTPYTKGFKVVAPIFTINQLREELAILEQAKPVKDNQF